MALLNRLQQTQPENLRVSSDHRLESDRGILIFGKQKYGSDRGSPYIDLVTNDGFSSYKFIKQGTGPLWDCYVQKAGELPVEKEILMDDMQDTLKSLNDLGIECGPLMKRALSGIGIQHDRAIRVGESLMTTALRRANLSVSKDGTISDAKAAQTQNQGGRS